MDQPDNLDDATLEYAAQLVEQISFSDVRGLGAKRKRDRDNAVVRNEARHEIRVEMARFIRAMMGRTDLTAGAILRRIAEADERQHVMLLRDAWPLAWKGWVDIEAVLVCNSNQIPPETGYRIKITKRGQAILDAEVAAVPDLSHNA